LEKHHKPQLLVIRKKIRLHILMFS